MPRLDLESLQAQQTTAIKHCGLQKCLKEGPVLCNS